MDKEKQDALYAKYPKLFKQKDDDMSTTCMCWGIECGNGWYELLNHLCEGLQETTRLHENGDKLQFIQIKEKFGELRAYCNGTSWVQDELIALAHHRSRHTCEKCGEWGEINEEGYWKSCLCDYCRGKK